MSRRKIKRKHQRRVREWVGARFQLSSPVVGEGPAYRPFANLWLELPDGYVLAAEIERPNALEGSLGTALRTAMERPMVGPPRQPRRIRVATQELAAEVEDFLRDHAKIPIFVAPTPEADEVFRSFEGGSQASGLGEYLAGELSAAAVDRFFVAARVLFALAPWKSLDDSMLIRVDSEALGLEGACISILGHQLEHRGFLILPSVADYDRLPDHGRPGPSMNGIAMSFDSRDEVAPEVLLEIEANGWPVASEDAYPVPMRIVEGCHAPVTDPELRVLAACCNALTGLIARSGVDAVADAATDQGAPICISFSDSDGVVTRLTVPPEAADLFDVDDAESSPANPQSPCPCGSGKVYGECHLERGATPLLAADPAAAAHELDRRLTPRIIAWSKRALSASQLRVRLPIPNAERMEEILAQWALYVREVEGQSIAARFLADQGAALNGDERAWIEAQTRSWLSIWEVAAVDPGSSLRIRDRLSGEVREVIEHTASTTLSLHDSLLARVVDSSGVSVLAGIHSMSLPPIEAAEVIARARRRLRRKRDVPVERLRSDRFASYLLRVWDEACEDLVRRASIPPDLRNTDDQPILLTVDRFEVSTGGRLRVEAALRELGMEESSARDGGTIFRLTRPDERLGAGRHTIVGLARVGDGVLKLETNSIERADRLRAQLEADCGGLIQHRVRSHTDPLSTVLPAGDTAPPRPQGPEVDKIVRQHKEQHYSTWPDEPLPALDGETPRAAVRTRAGRERVEVLIKDLERAESREPPGMRYDTTPLRRELGLDTDTL